MLPSLIKVADGLYKVVRVINFQDNLDVQAWKDWLGATHSFRKEDKLYFVEEVQVLEFEEIKIM